MFSFGFFSFEYLNEDYVIDLRSNPMYHLIKFEYCIAYDILLSATTVTNMTQHSLTAIELCSFSSLLG